jgi:parvulin-like peptidyl-prolyl isomerase
LVFRVLTLILIACPAAAGQAIVSHAASPEAVAATVDGVAIPRKLFDMYVRNGLEELAIDAQATDDEQQIMRLEKAVLDELIDRALVEGEVRRRGLTPDERALADSKRRWVARLGGENGYRAYLAQHTLTEEHITQIARQELAAATLRHALTQEVRVPDQEIEAFYRREGNNPQFAELFVEPEMATAQHILIAARPALVERELREKRGLAGAALEAAVHNEMRKRRQRAEDIRHQAMSGGDFSALAREHSNDAGTRPRGGDLGQFARGAHPEAFDAAVFALTPGQIGEVIQTEYGFHVVKLIARSAQRTRSLDEVRTAIEQRLVAAQTAEHLQRWLDDRRRNAVIHIDPSLSRISR